MNEDTKTALPKAPKRFRTQRTEEDQRSYFLNAGDTVNGQFVSCLGRALAFHDKTFFNDNYYPIVHAALSLLCKITEERRLVTAKGNPISDQHLLHNQDEWLYRKLKDAEILNPSDEEKKALKLALKLCTDAVKTVDDRTKAWEDREAVLKDHAFCHEQGIPVPNQPWNNGLVNLSKNRVPRVKFMQEVAGLKTADEMKTFEDETMGKLRLIASEKKKPELPPSVAPPPELTAQTTAVVSKGMFDQIVWATLKPETVPAQS